MSAHPFITALARHPDRAPTDLGFELVDIEWAHPDTDTSPSTTLEHTQADGSTTSNGYTAAFALANGDLILYDEHGHPIVTTWVTDRDLRVISGDTERIHRPGISTRATIDPTAYIHPTAHIAPHAIIGQHAHIGPHSWIGTNAHVGDYVEISDGAFIGRNTHLANQTRVGRGAVVGSHTATGPRTTIGAGATTAPHAYLEPGTTLGARHHQQRHHNTPDPYRVTQITNSIERLLSMDRD